MKIKYPGTTHNLFVFLLAMVLMVSAGCGIVPETPEGLTVTATSPVTLSWSAVSGATGYNVYRGTVSGDLSTKTRLAQDLTSTGYTDTSAAAGTTYYYQVTAIGRDGVSGASNEVNATAGGSFPVVGSVANGQITLNWSAVTNAASYSVYRGTTSGAITTKTKLSTNTLTTTYVDTPAASGTYYYQVTAVDSNGGELQSSTESPALTL